MSTTRKCDMCGTLENSDFNNWAGFQLYGKRIALSRDFCPKCSTQILALIEGKEVSLMEAALK